IREGGRALQSESGQRWDSCGNVAELSRGAGGDRREGGRGLLAGIRRQSQSRSYPEGAVCIAVRGEKLNGTECHRSGCSPARGGHFFKSPSPCFVRAMSWLNEFTVT